MGKGALLLGLLVVAAPVAAAAQGKVVLVGHPTIVVDPLCNSAAAGTTMLELRNEDPAGAAPVPLSLTATELVSKPAGRRMAATITFVPVTTATGDQPAEKKTLAGNEEVWVKVAVSGVHEEGEWETTLLNDNVELGPLRIVRVEVPFHVGLDVAKPEAPELTFVEGQAAHFDLRNEDNQTYVVRWEYTVDGAKVSSNCPSGSGCGDPSRRAPEADEVVIPAHGLEAIAFVPPDSWFPSWFPGLFKDKASDGLLAISRRAEVPAASGKNEVCTPATKAFKITTHLATGAGTSRELLADVVVFVLLLLGGICSLALNFAFPNQARRRKVDDKLAELNRKIADLSVRLASRPRVLVGLEAKMLTGRLRNLSLMNGDFATEMQSIEQATSRLETRIQILDRLGATRDDFERLECHDLPPTVIPSMDEMFNRIVAIGEKSDPSDVDVQSAQALIGDLQKQLDSIGRVDDALAAQLGRRFKALKQAFDPVTGSAARARTYSRVQAQLPGLLAVLDSPNEDTVGPERYVSLGGALFKLECLREFIELMENTVNPGDYFRREQPEREARFLALLQRDGWQSLAAARSLLLQMQEGTFKRDIEHALGRNRVRAVLDRVKVRQFEPCGFRLEFLDPALNKAAARLEWTCRWEFGLGDEVLREDGWEVTHYFKEVAKYQVKVMLVHGADGTTIETHDPAVQHITVGAEPGQQPDKTAGLAQVKGGRKRWQWLRLSSRRLEVLRLLLALFVALVALIAGAKDQLLKLDVIPALIAVFFVGFSADQIKNLLAQRPQANQ